MNLDYDKINAAVAAYAKRVAEINGVATASHQFNVDPSVQQRLESRMQESSEFLNRINITGVTAQQGEAVGIGVSGPIASRTMQIAAPSPVQWQDSAMRYSHCSQSICRAGISS